MTQKTAYLVAAGLFAATAGYQVGSSESVGLVALLFLVAAVVLGWFGVRRHTDKQA